MSEVLSLHGGGYRYIKGVFQYSGGVIAEAGHRIVRARFSKVPSLEDGFNAIRSHLQSIGRPLSALCACELRSPKPFTEQGFKEFNKTYVDALEGFDLLHDGLNPVARTNVCLEIGPAPMVSVYAFSYTVQDSSERYSRDFVISGSGEVPEGKSNYIDHVICLGDRSPEGLRMKARWVCEEMERRMRLLDFGWENVTGTQVYTVHDIHPFLADELIRRGAAKNGLNWHFSRPPVAQLDYEMDVRGVSREIVL
ncbi:MAG: hypothetical protein AB7L76_08990 [Burkholderiaceae bacterium]